MTATRAKKKTGVSTHRPLISDDSLRQMYAAMLKCRRFAERRNRSSLGLEAAVVGTTFDLLPQDLLVTAARDSSGPIARGVPYEALASGSKSKEVRRAEACLRQGVLAMAADTWSVAVGSAFAERRRETRGVTVALSEQWNEGPLCTAAEHRLAVLFVLISQGEEVRPAEVNGLPVIPVDCKDVVAVYRVAHESLTRARQGGGPTVIDCRVSPCTAEMESSQCAVAHMEQYLERKGLFSVAWKREIDRKIRLGR